MTMHVYIYTQQCIYTIMYCIYIYICALKNIYSTKSNERGWLYRYVCWQLSFYGRAAAECVGDGCCLCPASHLNKRLACIGLHSDVYIYIYTYVYVYIYIECVCIYMTMHVYIYTQLCIYTIIYRLQDVLADIKWTGEKNGRPWQDSSP